jgi:hypothetical protein
MIAVTGQSPSPDAPQGLSVLEAVLVRITYANEDTGYTIARVATDRTGPDLLTVAGPLLGAQPGEGGGRPAVSGRMPRRCGSMSVRRRRRPAGDRLNSGGK